THTNSLLSGTSLQKIGEKYLTGRDQVSKDQLPSYAPQTLQLGFTLANMQGIDYTIPYRSRAVSKTGFISTFFSHQRTNDVSYDTTADWSAILHTAVASGSFPFAFPPKALTGTPDEFPDSVQAEDGTLPHDLLFLDGGMFNNEPLKLAISLARKADEESGGNNRKYILVDSTLNQSSADYSLPSGISLLAQGKRLLGMIYGEAQAKDWIRAQKTNTQLKWRDQLLERLAQLITSLDSSQTDLLNTELDRMAKEIVALKRALYPSNVAKKRYPPDYLKVRLKAIGDRVKDHLDPQHADLYALATFTINAVAGTGNKKDLELWLIGAPPEDVLAGNIAGNFGGFFEQEWREHDFQRGRREANVQLNGTALPAYAKQDDLDAPLPDLSKVTLADADAGKRKRFRTLVLDKIEIELRDNIKFLRWPIIGWIMRKILHRLAKPVLNKWLMLK
ncbi:MAG: hypothetical protein ACE5H0_12310, partial [Bacteroidota bacterium]